jgi:hypothetical protein
VVAKTDAEVTDEEAAVLLHAAATGAPLANGAALQQLCPGATASGLLRVVRCGQEAARCTTTATQTRADAMKSLSGIAVRLGEQLESLENALRHHEARDAVVDAAHDAAKERRAHLDVLHALKAERKAQEAEQAAMEAEAARIEEEKQREKDRRRMQETAAQAAQFRAAKEATKAQERAEKEADEERKRAEFAAATDERQERLDYRRQAFETRRANVQQVKLDREETAKRKEQAVADFLRQVEESMGVERDADRLVGNTTASAARAEETEAMQKAMRVASRQVRAQPIAGFSDQRLHNDPRTRIAAALTAAGVGGTDYARSMIGAMGRVAPAAKLSVANPFAP